MKKTKPNKLEKKKCPICEWQKPVKGNRIMQHEYAKSGLTCGGSKRHVGPLFFFGTRLRGDPDKVANSRSATVYKITGGDYRAAVRPFRSIETLGKTPENALVALEERTLRNLNALKKIVGKRR